MLLGGRDSVLATGLLGKPSAFGWLATQGLLGGIGAGFPVSTRLLISGVCGGDCSGGGTGSGLPSKGFAPPGSGGVPAGNIGVPPFGVPLLGGPLFGGPLFGGPLFGGPLFGVTLPPWPCVNAVV